ncbi:MAG: hypothetical protein ACRD3Q_16300 [Terriglobales bacterium]
MVPHRFIFALGWAFARAFTVRIFVVAVFAVAAFGQTAAAPTKPAAKVAPDEQLVVYRNAALGFRYKIPFGWVDRTQEMRAQAAETKDEPAAPPEAGTGSSNAKASARANAAKGKSASDVLLAVFERPPLAAGDSVNSAVVIATESAAAYPGLKTAADFLGPLTALTTAQGFTESGDTSAVTIDGREWVRADFSKALTEKVTMYQSTLILLAKGQIVTFTFVAGGEDEIDELVEKLEFASGRTK